MKVNLLSRVQLFVTLWGVAHQAPLSMGFFRQEYHLTQPCPLEEKRKTLSINLTLNEAYTNHCTNLRRAENKRQKEFKLFQRKNSTFLEDWEKETSTTISLKKNEKVEKYYTNEGTN